MSVTVYHIAKMCRTSQNLNYCVKTKLGLVASTRKLYDYL